MNIPETTNQRLFREYYGKPSTVEPESYGAPEEILTNDDLQEVDIMVVLSLFDRLTTQEKISQEEENILAEALIHAIEKVQKNLDNLI